MPHKNPLVWLPALGVLLCLVVASCVGGEADSSSQEAEADFQDAQIAPLQPNTSALPSPGDNPLGSPDALDALLEIAPDNTPSDEEPGSPDLPAATGEPATTPAEASSEQLPSSFTLAYLLSTTGELAILAAPLITAIQMAVTEANEAGFQNVSLVAGDTSSDLNMARETADILLASGADGVIGALTSSLSLAVIDQFVAASTPIISPSSTSPQFTFYDDNGYFFRTSASDLLKGKALADIIQADGAQKVAVVSRDDEYGESLSALTIESLESYGVEIVAEIKTDPEPESFSEQIAEIRDSGADAVALITFEEGSLFLAEWMMSHGRNSDAAEGAILPQNLDSLLQNLGSVNFYFAEQPLVYPWEDQAALNSPLLGNLDDAYDSEFFANLDGITTIKAVTAGQHPEVENTFPQRFMDFVEREDFACAAEMSATACEASKILGPFVAETYDAAVILLLAGLQEGQEPLVGYINDVTRDGIKCSHYISCAALIGAGFDIDYQGVSGPLEFTDVGEPRQGAYRIGQINDLNQLQTGEDFIIVF